MEEFTLTILGSGSALTMHNRHPSGQVVQSDDFCCLIDCGEGTQERLKPAGVRPFKINMILISHLHGDHVFGLPGLLSSFTHLKRTEALTICGPIGLKGFLESIFLYSELKVSYPLTILERAPKKLNRIYLSDNLEIMTFPLYHRIACNGYLFKELNAGIRLKKEYVLEYALSPDQIHAVRRGEEIVCQGKRMPASFFIQVPIAPVSYAYCSDTRYEKRLLAHIQGVSVLYHETTFMNNMEVMAEKTGHSTAGQAGRMAADAGVSCLITGHYSSRYKDLTELIGEAGENFDHVILAEEGKKYNLRHLAKGLSV